MRRRKKQGGLMSVEIVGDIFSLLCPYRRLTSIIFSGAAVVAQGHQDDV
jgi:hypothetical protein